ncbi:hypothetical protein ACHAXT_009609 [Thalassiosira profunda]
MKVDAEETKAKGGVYILHAHEEGHPRHAPLVNEYRPELGMRQLYDEESKTLSYLIWDKKTEDAVIIDPVRDQVARDLVVSTNLNLRFAINTHVHEDHVSGTKALKKKVKGLRSVISKDSCAEADEYIEDGDEIHFGTRFIVAIATPGHTNGCISFLLDDGKAVLTGDTLLVGGPGPVLEESGGSAWSLCDSLFHKLFDTLPHATIVLPGHDFGGGLTTTIGRERALLVPWWGETMEDFVVFVNSRADGKLFLPKDADENFACNMKDGATSFNLRSLRTRRGQRWGIFG